MLIVAEVLGSVVAGPDGVVVPFLRLAWVGEWERPKQNILHQPAAKSTRSTSQGHAIADGTTVGWLVVALPLATPQDRMAARGPAHVQQTTAVLAGADLGRHK